MNPIFVETPYYIEPVYLPTIEMGKKIDDSFIKNSSLNNSKLPSIRNSINEKTITPVIQRNSFKKEYSPSENENNEKENENEKDNDNKNDDSVQNNLKNNKTSKWWKLVRDFVLLYNFMLTSKKYVRYALKRNRYIKDRYNSLENEIDILKEWIIDIERPFFDNFEKYERVNIRFRNHDSEVKINKKSQELYKLIKIFMEYLIGNTKKLSMIPQEIQNILYEYIREKGYYPKKYLSSFQYNRLDFDFYGRTKNMNDKRGGLILAFLIISGITVQEILLHLHELFPKYNSNPYFISNCKYIGSLLHFLTRDTFNNNPQIYNDSLSLVNYYRNYHINEDEIRKQKNIIFPNYKIFKDKDEFAQFLVSESKINQVWEIDPDFVDTYKKFIFEWAVNLSKLLRLQYSHHESTMKNKKKSSRSPYK